MLGGAGGSDRRACVSLATKKNRKEKRNRMKAGLILLTLVIGSTAQLPWEPCLGLSTKQCIPMDFSTFSASDFDTVGGGAWARTSSGTLKVSAPSGGATGATCERLGGSALTLKAASGLPTLRSGRARMRVSGGDGSVGFIFRRSNADNYGLMVAYTDSSCGGNTGGIVAGVARVTGYNHIKPAFVMGLPGITIVRDTWYTLSFDLVNDLIRWRLQTESWMTGGGGAFFSDFVFNLLNTSAGATGGGFGFYCSPGATCEFDDAVFYDTAIHRNLTGHLYCHYCSGVVWPVASADWCRCCQYSCGSNGDEMRQACTKDQGFCTQANRCQSTLDSDRGYPVTYCASQVLTASALPPTQPTVPGQTPVPPVSTTSGNNNGGGSTAPTVAGDSTTVGSGVSVDGSTAMTAADGSSVAEPSAAAHASATVSMIVGIVAFYYYLQ